MSKAASDTPRDTPWDALLSYIQRNRGFDFRGYKQAGLERRVRRRMQMVESASFEDYIDYLEVHPEEFPQLFNTILINVTGFFRDAQAWDFLSQHILVPLLKDKEPDSPIRIWSAGCASGEEAYTLAIVFAQLLGLDAFRKRVKIYATDIDEDALGQARQASYSEKDVQPVSPQLRKQFFETNAERLIFRPDLRRAIIFGRHDLITDAPISRLDLVVCRNTLMYFNAETQAHIINRFHFALNDPGTLFLGRAEMLLMHPHLFTPISIKHRIFTKVAQPDMRDRLVLATHVEHRDPGDLNQQVRLRELAFEHSPSAQIVLDVQGQVVLINSQARASFGLTPQDCGRPIQDLELSYRPLELRSLVEEVATTQRMLKRVNVEWTPPGGSFQRLDVEVTPLQDNELGLIGVVVSFYDTTQLRRLEADLIQATEEAETTSEELQSTNEELETTNEELQSTVEELETTNEELQSTNEEMETMNEELQSTNEEIQTVNQELRERTDELHLTNGFLESVLGSLRVGIVVLNRTGNVLRWNEKAQDMWGLRADEVEGQAFFGLDIGLPVEKLRGVVRQCLKTKSPHRDLELPAVNRRGKKIRCQVSCSPLSGIGSPPQGVILLMEEFDAE